MEQKLYLAILHFLWFSHKKLHLIFENNNNYKWFFEELSTKKLLEYWFKNKKVDEIFSKLKELDIKKFNKKLIDNNIEIITINEESYPSQLKQIANKPFLIYAKWNIDYDLGLWIIWSRNITEYWKKVIKNFTPWLTDNFTIISWWATWCDSHAHKETIINNWKTISVIWTWIDIDYPSINKKLYSDIIKSWWWIISIFPLEEPWNPFNFPIRNEIIAWLSSWILVIEAAEKSWSLITAKLALDLGKDLFAIPWEIYKETSKWCNKLISSGEAKLVNSISDITEEYWIKLKTIKSNIKLNDDIEKEIYSKLTIKSQTSDELNKSLKINISTLNLKLSFMELWWIIQKISNWKYSI
jgi:DNA processing protein